MATFRASRWADGLTGNFNRLMGAVDDAGELVAENTEISDGFLIQSTPNQLTVGLVPSGTLNVVGSGLDGNGRTLTINQLSISMPSASLSLAGALSFDLVSGATSGQISRITGQVGGVTIDASGTYRFTLGGDLFANNAVETVRIGNGDTLIGRTNSAGQYTSFEFGGGGLNLSASGVWGYNTVSSLQDLMSGADVLIGTAAKDFLPGSRGNDRFEGGADIDTVVYQSDSRNYSISRSGSALVVSSFADGTDTLVDVERIRFSNKTIGLDVDGNAGQTYRLYQAAFDRTPDFGGLGAWIRNMDGGMGLETVASHFIRSAEFAGRYGPNPSNAQFVTLLYNNVLDRQPDPSGFGHWLGELESGRLTREKVLIGFSESQELKATVIGQIQGGIDFAVIPG